MSQIVNSVATATLVLFGINAYAGSAEQITPMAGNPNILRWAAGQIEYRTISNNAIRGYEQWHMTVYADGTRSLYSQENNFATLSVRESTYVVDSDFRPVSLYEQLWVEGTHRGTGWFSVEPGQVRALVFREDVGHIAQDLRRPSKMVMVAHSLATDGWIGALVEERPGQNNAVSAYVVDPYGKSSGSIIGQIQTLNIEFVGDETITVPAGTFDTKHFRIVDASADYWIMGNDKILVKYAYTKSDREYVLLGLATGSTEPVSDVKKKGNPPIFRGAEK
ncbi:MAG: hypothetical protein IT354_05455 [Gemmatimonadaceae bacterium]|nr:hypothetical protein [Gemmatimonadaceae bacterium]